MKEKPTRYSYKEENGSVIVTDSRTGMSGIVYNDNGTYRIKQYTNYGEMTIERRVSEGNAMVKWYVHTIIKKAK